MNRTLPDLQPAIPKCYFCCEDKNEVLIDTRLRHITQHKMGELHGKVLDSTPCQKCSDIMELAVILITIDPEKSEPNWNIPPSNLPKNSNWLPNPYRTGGWFGVSDDFVKRVFDPQFQNFALANRFMFIEHDAAEQLGLFEAAKTAPNELN
jgi:hypothetical protein